MPAIGLVVALTGSHRANASRKEPKTLGKTPDARGELRALKRPQKGEHRKSSERWSSDLERGSLR
jgi:hypothetical protein